MKNKPFYPLITIALFFLNSTILATVSIPSFASEGIPKRLSFTSPQAQVAIVELYSSQGCSSCPPAEKWLNRFTADPRLWQAVIPLAFHVDYWDYIGWSDPFAKAEYSFRQQRYKRAGQINSVYTPGFVVNGAEWRGWFSGKPLPTKTKLAGIIAVEIEPSSLSLEYSPVSLEQITLLDTQGFDIHMALLGFGLETMIKRGENARLTLIEEFVVLEYEKQRYTDSTVKIAWPKSKLGAAKYAIVVWLTKIADLSPVQATGGYIPREWLATELP